MIEVPLYCAPRPSSGSVYQGSPILWARAIWYGTFMGFLPRTHHVAYLLFTLVAGPERSLRLKLSDARVDDPQIRTRLGTTAHLCKVVGLVAGNLGGAIKEYRKALALAPTDPTFIFNLAQARPHNIPRNNRPHRCLQPCAGNTARQTPQQQTPPLSSRTLTRPHKPHNNRPRLCLQPCAGACSLALHLYIPFFFRQARTPSHTRDTYTSAPALAHTVQNVLSSPRTNHPTCCATQEQTTVF